MFDLHHAGGLFRVTLGNQLAGCRTSAAGSAARRCTSRQRPMPPCRETPLSSSWAGWARSARMPPATYAKVETVTSTAIVLKLQCEVLIVASAAGAQSAATPPGS